MAGFYSWIFLLNDTPEHKISVLLIILIGPLLFPLMGLLKGKIYTHAWSIYLAIFYFIVGVWYSSADHSFYFGLYVISMSMLFLIGTSMYTRYASIHDRQQAARQEDQADD
jgi:uncharacterized membrane protein